MIWSISYLGVENLGPFGRRVVQASARRRRPRRPRPRPRPGPRPGRPRPKNSRKLWSYQNLKNCRARTSSSSGVL